MKRTLFNNLLSWKDLPGRMPLLLRGARQIGKTYLVEAFGQAHFPKFHNINFELEPEYQQCFETLDPHKIIEAIAGLSGQKIEPGKSLLFLDEIQISPRAIMSLRYFKEKMPELHVIAAGSLLEFTLRDKEFSMPVGRVEYLYMKPLSFREFLIVSGYDALLEAIQLATFQKPISDVFHNKLLQLIRDYLLVGGMPAAVAQYITQGQFESAQRQQTIILSTYRDDFSKFSKLNDHKYLQKVFEKTPALIGQQIQYTKIDSDFRSRDLKRAIYDLSSAGVIYSINGTPAAGLPLNAMINEKKFKLLFLDVGLVNRTMRLTANDLNNEDITIINSGAIAEQLVGQELLAYMEPHDVAELHFWTRDKVGSQAEVDYVVTVNSTIVPIEVKAGVTGSLKSLHMLMHERKLPVGVRVSQQPLYKDASIVSIPFYMLSELNRLILEVLNAHP